MRRLILAIGAVSLLACGDSDPSGPGSASAEGTWDLITINGSPLPFTVIELAGSYRFEVISDRFVAHSSGTWTETFTYRETEEGVVTTTTETDVGTWSQSGSNVTVTASDGRVTTVTISGDRITLSEGGFVSVYARD
jgi:hypothetical protein